MPFDGQTLFAPSNESACLPAASSVRLTADETAARDNLWAILDTYPREAPVVLAAAYAGRIHGMSYSLTTVEQDCGCLFAHIAGDRGDGSAALRLSRAWRSPPDSYTFQEAERFVSCLLPGDTPATSDRCAKLAAWITAWAADRQVAS